MVSLENIQNNVRTYTEDVLGKDFAFRKHQFEIICDTIYNIVNNTYKTQIIEAPTGSGKSIISIICAGVLSKYYDKSSYILCSDLFLWDQYNKYIKKNKLKFGTIKGQIGNYICNETKEDLQTAPCRISNVSWSKLMNPDYAHKLGYDCAGNCKYLQERRKALHSGVVLITYQLFLMAMSLIKEPGDNLRPGIFKQRDVIFCDECHNIPGIVQTQWTPTIRKKDFVKIADLFEYAAGKEGDLFEQNKYDYDILKKYNAATLYKACTDIFDKLTDDSNTYEMNYNLLNQYMDLLDDFIPVSNDILDELSEYKDAGETLSKEDLRTYKLAKWLKDYYGFFTDFLFSIKETGKNTMIVQMNPGEDPNIQFNNTKEDYMVYKYLLSKAKNCVMLSATVGGKTAFDENIGIRFTGEESVMKKIPSTFNFEKSPIYFINKFSMGYREKQSSFPYLKTMVYQILKNKFKDEKGIIQTGSYTNAKELYDDAPYDIRKRMLIYNNSKEKEMMIKRHLCSTNSILVGPTLNEGIDLPDDLCRFIIILKVPYPSLGNKLVKAKLNLFPHWYESTTSNDIIQGVGRGIRNENDYCTTYILDSCFMKLYNNTKEQYSEDLQKRIKIF